MDMPKVVGLVDHPLPATEKSQIELLHEWTACLESFIKKLAEKNPEKEVLSEITYWKEMSHDLQCAKREMNDHIESSVNAVLEALKDSDAARDDILRYLDQIDRIYRGLKEAKWNDKYLSVIEEPVAKV